MSQIVPFPLARRKQWLADLIDQGTRLNLYDASDLYTQRIGELRTRLRALGVPEELVQADIAPVKGRLKDEIRVRTSRLNKNYRLSCDPEDFPDWKPGQVLQRNVY